MTNLSNRLAFLALALLVLDGCGDDSQSGGGTGGNSGVTDASAPDTATSDAASDITADTPADAATDAAADVAADTAIDSAGDTANDVSSDTALDAVTDAPNDVSSDAAPQGDLITEEFVNLAFELDPMINVKVGFDLFDATTEVEMLLVREFSGYTAVQDDTGGTVMSASGSPGWATDTLPAGHYDFYCSKAGSPETPYMAVKVMRRPSYAPTVATFAGVALEYGSYVDPGMAIPISFQVDPGHRYVIRGVRGRNTMILVAADQLPLIENGQSFYANYAWDESSYQVAPQATELDLDPGDYALIFANLSSDGLTHGSVARIEAWAEK